MTDTQRVQGEKVVKAITSSSKDEATQATQATQAPEVKVSTDHTPTEIAESLGVDPKAVRSFMRRNMTVRAGRGGRWALTSDEARIIATAFTSRSTHGATRPDMSKLASFVSTLNK